MKTVRHLAFLLAFAPAVLPAQGGSAGAVRGGTPADSVRLQAASESALDLLSAGRYDSAAVVFRGILAERRVLNDSAGLGRTLNSLGTAHYQMGQYELALEYFLESLEYRRALGDLAGSARVLTNIGVSFHDLRQFERSLPVLQQALAVADSSGQPFAIGYALTCLGELYSDLGRLPEARAHLERSVSVYTTAGSRMSADDSASGWALNTPALARLAVREGNPQAALAPLQRLLAASRQLDRARGEARANLYLAEAYRALGDRRLAMQHAERALEVARRIDQRAMVLSALQELTALHELEGHAGEALRYLRAHQALRDTVFDQEAGQRIAAMEARTETQRLQRETAEQEQVIGRQRLVGVLGAAVLILAAVLVLQLVRFNKQGREREALLARTNTELGSANAELRTALSEVRQLKGLIPICANCKRIRDDQGFWEAVETYIADRSHAMFSHGICNNCGPELYGDAWHVEGRSAPEPRSAPDASPTP